MSDLGRGRDAYVRSVVDRAGVVGRVEALREAARSLAAVSDSPLDESVLALFDGPNSSRVTGYGPDAGPIGAPTCSPAEAPYLLGACHEALLTTEQRTAGAHHTPAWVARRVVHQAVTAGRPVVGDGVDRSWVTRATVCDPAVGGGVFLLAAAEQLHDGGLSRVEAVARLWGFDTDPLAVAVTESALALWAGAPPAGVDDRLVVADFLGAEALRLVPPTGWSLVVGNPPFQSQLSRGTARDRDRAEALRRRFGAVAGGYVDEAGLFVVAGVAGLAEDGRLALVLPASLLAADAAAPLRSAVTEDAPMRSVWIPDRQPFTAAVDVVVPVFARRGGRGAGGVTRRCAERGPGVERPNDAVTVLGGDGSGAVDPLHVPSPGSTWSALLADAEGVPRVDLADDAGRVGDLASATAGFRQHFYGLAGAVAEGAPGSGRPLLTVGLVDPLTSHWGRRPTRLAGTAYASPVVDPALIDDPEVAAWVQARNRPKLVVATQTRVLEALVDDRGTAVPSTPLISVEPHDPDADLWGLAAVLSAPPVTAWCHRRGAGGGLSAGRIRPTASLVRQVPLPADESAWSRGAHLARQASGETDPVLRRKALVSLGSVMTAAYGAPDAVVDWWRGLLPRA